MAVFTRTIDDVRLPRLIAAFNARFRSPRDTTTTDRKIVEDAIDAFIRGVIEDYEAGVAAAAAVATTRSDIIIT